jgi:hypothetical protein
MIDSGKLLPGRISLGAIQQGTVCVSR